MVNQEKQCLLQAQEANQSSLGEITSTSQEGILITDEDRLEMVTGAGFCCFGKPAVDEGSAAALGKPGLARTWSGTVATTDAQIHDASRCFAHHYKGPSGWLNAVKQPDGTFHLSVSQEKPSDAYLTGPIH
jgi:hypothetical protein